MFDNYVLSGVIVLRKITEVEVILEEMEEEHITGYLLEVYLENFDHLLPEWLKGFLKEIEIMTKEDFEELKKKNLDIGVSDDPWFNCDWPALIPRLLYKMIHVFGYPRIKTFRSRHGLFAYFFKYKGHIIRVDDNKGYLRFIHRTVFPVGKREETPPQEGAEEILDEFQDNLVRFALTITPMNYASAVRYL